ncbi:MAG: hypothetical protein HY303_12925 [Candidatus Wallbacteria bacterium]|nr:hypothetical protein [Candidatus Wallbacteria bacterium]
MAEVIMKMLSRLPEQRYKDMRTVHRTLQVAALKATASEKEPAPSDRPGKRTTNSMPAVRGPSDASQDTPGVKRASRSTAMPQTISMSRVAVAVRPAAASPPRSKTPPMAALAGAAVLGLATVLGWAVLHHRSARPAVEEPPSPAPPTPVAPVPPAPPPPPPAKAPEVNLPAAYPRIGVPHCAKLEGPGGHITPLDVARCEVKRWLASWEKHVGRDIQAEFGVVVEEKKAPKDALALMELFESAPAQRALQALAYLRDSKECQPAERFDAGLASLKAYGAHAACLWHGFGAAVEPKAKFPFPKLFLLPAGGFYPAWEKQWLLASGWEQQATVLGEWISFHRALDEERILWAPGTAHESVLGGMRPDALLREDLGYVLTRIWRMRARGQQAEAMPIWKQAVEKLAQDGPGMPTGKRAALTAWIHLEGCLMSLSYSRDLAGVRQHAAEARKAIALCKDDKGADRMGIASWREWKQLGSLGK